MNRRSFLKMMGSVAPVAAVAPTYFFAPVGGWKSDVIINPHADLPPIVGFTESYHTHGWKIISASCALVYECTITDAGQGYPMPVITSRPITEEDMLPPFDIGKRRVAVWTS